MPVLVAFDAGMKSDALLLLVVITERRGWWIVACDIWHGWFWAEN
jgi:hypothetical protein